MTNLSVFASEIPGLGYDAAVPLALVVAASPTRAREAVEALTRAGYRVREPVGFEQALDELAAPGALDLIAIEAEDAAEALLDQVLACADAAARARPLAVMATVAPGQIDVAAALLTAPRTQLLCDPDPVERMGALACARHASAPRLTDVTRDGESARLQRLNEEVARIADTLARLTRGEEGDYRPSLRDPGTGYRGPDGESAGETSPQEVRAVIRSRRLRAQFFEAALFADPAWDMLLDLFASDLERRRVSVSSLCIAASVPPTTALRWIGTLHDAGLFERQADPSDRRRAYIALSAKGLEGMRGYAGAAKRAGLNMV